MENKNWKRILWVLLILYILVLYALLFKRPVKSSAYFDHWELMRRNTFLQPLGNIRKYLGILHEGTNLSYIRAIKRELVGNTVLFMPMAFFLPALFPGMRSFLQTMSVIFLMVLGVELIQVLCLVGSFDVDDILLNTLGAPVGYFVYRLTLGKQNRL